MEAAGAGKAGFIGGVEDGGLVIFEDSFCMFDADILEELFWADAGPVREEALEVEGAEMDLAGDGFEVGLSFEIFANVVDGFGYTFVIELLLLFHVFAIYNTNVDRRGWVENPVLEEIWLKVYSPAIHIQPAIAEFVRFQAGFLHSL